jgi:hypothetical protein
MKPKFLSPLLALVVVSLLGSGLAFAEGASNARERFFVKRQNCPWTDEMGKYIYECVKANFGFSAHWCHNADETTVPGPASGAAPAAKPDALDAERQAASRQGEDSLKGTIEREQTMLKYKDCKWTDDMGKFVYECVKRNNGFGVHWCHDEALQTMCPAPKT